MGGVLGSLISSHLNINLNHKVNFFLLLQLLVTLLYPNYSLIHLFLLGIAVGAMAPLMIESLKKGGSIEMTLALGIAYTIGTYFFNYEPTDRMFFGISFSAIAITAYQFIDKFPNRSAIHFTQNFSLLAMTFWVFLDSALFETLSRDAKLSIWRDGYTYNIILFHIIGVIVGASYKLDNYKKSLLIFTLFMLSYFFYILKEPNLLSIVYPFVISYYNMTILQSLTQVKSLKELGIYMVFIGWIASGAGLVIALSQTLIYLPLLFLTVLLYTIFQFKPFYKEHYHG